MTRPAPPVAELVGQLLGTGLPLAIRAYDGSRSGSVDPLVSVDVRSPVALRRILTAPGELGLVRAYVAGDLDLDGDLYQALRHRDKREGRSRSARSWLSLLRLMTGPSALGWPPPPPPEEVRIRGRRHTKARDAAAISHHYDVGNEFYRLLLGPSMTYSCAVWEHPWVGLDAAQTAKHELVCRKLGLKSGQRLLDVGCGWGSTVIHAARHYGVRAVGVTISERQAALARERVAAAGVGDRVEIRVSDYRDVTDGPYDAISSIGMFEHVGAERLEAYFTRLSSLLAPAGRLLNHGISRPPARRPPRRSRGFIQRYVFPDGELHELGAVVSRIQATGLEVRHTENLREHYALTLRAWVDNLEQGYDEAVALVGSGRARVWRLFLTGSALAFEDGLLQVHQTLAVNAEAGRSEFDLRPAWERASLTPSSAQPLISAWPAGAGHGPVGKEALASGVPHTPVGVC